MLGGLWEFPGGKRQKGESLAETARREIREETAVNVKAGKRLCLVKHAYSHFKIRLHAFECSYQSGRARAITGSETRWVPMDRLHEYPFPSANKRILDVLLSGEHKKSYDRRP
jgi:A/G-specific adenine glycosylase